MGQRIMLAVSSDGACWSDAEVLVSPGDILSPQAVLTAAGLHVYQDRPVVYFSHYVDEVQLGLVQDAMNRQN